MDLVASIPRLESMSMKIIAKMNAFIVEKTDMGMTVCSVGSEEEQGNPFMSTDMAKNAFTVEEPEYSEIAA